MVFIRVCVCVCVWDSVSEREPVSAGATVEIPTDSTRTARLIKHPNSRVFFLLSPTHDMLKWWPHTGRCPVIFLP